MTPLRGLWYAAGKSSQLTAQIQVTETGRVTLIALDKTIEREMPSCTFQELSISPRLGNTARHITFPDGSHFETDNNDQIDRFLAQFEQGYWLRALHYLESHLTVVLLFVLLVSFFIWGSVRYGVPVVARVAADALPVEIVQYLGNGTLELLDEAVFQPSTLDGQRQRQLAQEFRTYTAEYPELDIKVDFRHGDKIGANAMALPDGHIIFTDELVELAQDDLELVAILGHEIGHLAHRHLLRRMIQDSLVTVLLVMISGDVSSASSIIYALPALLLELSYSRAFEEEADDFALQFLTGRGISPHYFAAIMQRLMGMTEEDINSGQKDPSDLEADQTSYFSTHPDTRKRIQKFVVE